MGMRAVVVNGGAAGACGRERSFGQPQAIAVERCRFEGIASCGRCARNLIPRGFAL